MTDNGFKQAQYPQCNQCQQYILSLEDDNDKSKAFGPMTPICGGCGNLNPTCIVPCENFPNHLLHPECLRKAIFAKKCTICEKPLHI